MAETPKSPTLNNFYNILGIPKTASLNDICKAYKSLVMKWHPDKNSNKPEAEAKFQSINEAYRALSSKKRDETTQYVDEPKTPPSTSSNEPKTPKSTTSSNKPKDEPKTPKSTSSSKRKDDGNFVISNPTLLSRTGSHTYTSTGTSKTFSGRRNSTPTPLEFYASLSRCVSDQNAMSTPSTPGSPVEGLANISRTRSRRSISTPIIFSQSIARKKPPPIERKLECTLEELCHGSKKKVKITRDVISDFGFIVQEEEILKIRVKPGWKKGTKIMFEGKGDERPGTLPADIIFVVDEKMHPLYKRIGDDLELGVEVPLVQALTGCTIDVPLLGGEQMNLWIDDIIYPEFEKFIPGQGMTISKDGARGNLRLKFLVEFPTELSDEQRDDVVSILSDCS